MLPSHSSAPHDEDSLEALLAASRWLSAFWPPFPRGTQPGVAPRGPITVPARARELVAGLPEYGW